MGLYLLRAKNEQNVLIRELEIFDALFRLKTCTPWPVDNVGDVSVYHQ